MANAQRDKEKVFDKPFIEKLSGDNYATWSTDMKWLLIMKGIWNAVVDHENVDEADDLTAMAFIGLNVEKHLKTTIDACDTAKEAWDKLEDVYKAKSNARKLQLKRELTSISLKPKESITLYVSRAKDIRDQLIAAGYEASEEEVALSLLAGLPEGYESIVDTIQATTEALDIDELMPKLLIVEQRVKDRNDASLIKEKAFVVCFKCGQKGHIKRNCPKKKEDEKDKRRFEWPQRDVAL